jgi:heavy metal sensor kinase
MLHELDERVDDIASFLSTLAPGTDRSIVRAELMREYQPKDEGKWLQILDEQGNWLYFSSRGSVADPIPPRPPDPGKLVPFKVLKPHSLRVLTRRIEARGHSYSISTAMSADRSTRILAKFRTDLWLLVPVVVLSAAWIGHLLSRKALSPVAAIVAEARRINERNLATRVPAIHTRDELSELSETLNQMLERIETAFRSVRSLTANASHELRTPLSLIRTRVEIALCFPRTVEQYQTILEDVQLESLRMTSLVENLLVLARSDAGAAQMELRPVLLSALVAQVAQEWALTAERLSLNLQLTAISSPVWVLGNQESLQRLLRILLDNACRFTPSGGWVTLNVQEADNRAAFTIQDNGIGIAEQDLPHIFERFYRAEKPQHREETGSGLGLSLAKWIADQHKAYIVVDSARGAGSCFRVIFPEYVSPGSLS